MDEEIYKCQLCNRMYHDKEVVINLSSKESKREQITSKILSALSIMITDNDPTVKYICRVCYGQVEVNFRFATTCRINNANHMKNLINLPSNNMLKTEYNKFMRIPIHVLFNKYQFDAEGLFDAVTSYLNDTNEDLNSTQYFENFAQYFGLNNNDSITNHLNIENDNPVGNGILKSSPVLEVNVPNINTNNINHAAKTGINKNVQFNTNFPITNNVIKKSKFCILSRPPPLLKIGQIAGTNIVQNSSVATCKNQTAMNNYATRKSQSAVNNYATRKNQSAANSLAATRKNQSTTNSLATCKNQPSTSSLATCKNQPSTSSLATRKNQSAANSLATCKNQSTANSSTFGNTINNHSYSVLSKENGTTDVIEVICLDDDDDDDDIILINDSNNNNDNNNDVQDYPRDENHINRWLVTDHSNHLKLNTYKTYQRINLNDPFSVKRKVISLPDDNVQSTNTVHSSNILSEEMMITPDLENFSTFNVDSSINGEDEYFEIPPQVNNASIETLLVASETEPSRILPNTGFHFLFATDEIVDLTIKEDNTPPKKKPISRKRKNPDTKKAVPPKKEYQNTSIVQYNQKAKSQQASCSNHQPTTAIQKKKRLNISSKPRPKRASATTSTPEIINSGLWKLGKHLDGYWTADACPVLLSLFRCPICDVLYWSLESRQRHEMSMHSSLHNSIHQSAVDFAPLEENSACTQQLYLLNYLQLCLVKDSKPNAIIQLTKRTHLLKALKTLGPKTIGSFKCDYCPYKTNLMFALWAHMSSNHLRCNFEKKSSLFCFLCSRPVSKRTTLLKHIDKCSKEILDNNNSCNRFICVHCNLTFDSLIKLEEHTWNHQ